MWQNTSFFSPSPFFMKNDALDTRSAKDKDCVSGDASVIWPFDLSQHFSHSELHTCVNKDNKDVQMHHHASLPEAMQPGLFFFFLNISHS